MMGILYSVGILVAILLVTAIVSFLVLSFVIFLWGIAEKNKKPKTKFFNHNKKRRSPKKKKKRRKK